MMQPLRRLLCLFLLASCVAVACSSPSYTPGNPLIVEDPSPETFQECEERIHATSNKPYSDPYRQVLEDCVPEIGVNGVLDIIEAANDFCHDEGHQLGILAVGITRNRTYLLETVELRCRRGAIHGVVEALFIGVFDDFGVETPVDFTTLGSDVKQQLREVVDEWCLPDVAPGNCLHAFGHSMVMMAVRSNSVAQMENSICLMLMDDPEDVDEYWKIHNCLGGVMMQEELLRFPNANCVGVRAQGECWVYRAQYPRRCSANPRYGQSLDCVPRPGRGHDCVRRGVLFGYASRHSDMAPAGSKADHLLDCMEYFEDRQDQIVCVEGYTQHAGYAWPSEADGVCLGLFAQYQDQEMYERCVASVEEEIHGIGRDCSAIVCMDNWDAVHGN